MEITYTIIGADGQQYGPISLEQLKLWASEGRIGPTTRVMRSDTQSWLPAAQYTELGLAQSIPTSAPGLPPPSGASPAFPSMSSVAGVNLQRKMLQGARWFYWIAGLSAINTIVSLSKGGFYFVAGLGITQVFDGLAASMHSGGATIGLLLNALVTGMFVLLGVFACKGQSWSFIIGMILYAADGLLIVVVFLLAGAEIPYISLLFHGFVLYGLIAGFRANLQLKALARGVIRQGG
jgi:hypothetical protein